MENEKRLISYDVLIKHLDSCIKQGKGLSKSVCVAIKCFVEQMPTVDAVEVVRCWKCRFCKEHPTSDKAKMCVNENWNTEYYPLVHDNDFCSYAERRTDG